MTAHSESNPADGDQMFGEKVSGWSQSGHTESGQSSAEGMQQQFSWAADKAKSEATEAIQPMRDSARKVAQDQKNVLAERIGGFAKAIDAAAGQYEQESPAMRDMLRAAAGSVRSASDTLRERHIDDLTGAAQNFARHRPAAFFAGAVAAGFALSRFLKSSASEHGGRAGR